MKLPLPETVKLKEPKEWKVIGTVVRRLDTPEKITGKAQFGIDVAFPGLRTAVVLRPPACPSTTTRATHRRLLSPDAQVAPSLHNLDSFATSRAAQAP